MYKTDERNFGGFSSVNFFCCEPQEEFNTHSHTKLICWGGEFSSRLGEFVVFLCLPINRLREFASL